MDDMVGSIHRVSDIVAEIASASDGRNNGLQQIGAGAIQMNQATQQVAARVEESAAAADCPRGRVQQPVHTAAMFQPSREGSASRAHLASSEHRNPNRGGNVTRPPWSRGCEQVDNRNVQQPP